MTSDSENIIEWTRIATNSMPAQIVRNAWRHGQYSWFPPAPAAEANAEEAEPTVLDDGVELAQESEDDESDDHVDDSTDTE